MTIEYREMLADEAETAAGMVRKLATDVGANIVPCVRGVDLLNNRDLIDATVAHEGENPVGICLMLMTFSTWRGTKGAYVVDLYVDGNVRGRGVGRNLLRYAAERMAKRGAKFVKLEVDVSNEAAVKFYRSLGFVGREADRLYILEGEDMNLFIGREKN